MRALAMVAVVFASTVLAPASAFAQGAITGTVKDLSGAVLPGATWLNPTTILGPRFVRLNLTVNF